MRKAIFTLVLLTAGLPLLAQTLPDSAGAAGPVPPLERKAKLIPDSAKAGRGTSEKEKPAAVKTDKSILPEEKPAIAKQTKPLPRVAVLDFVNAGGAPSRLSKSIAERMRFYLLNSGQCLVIDAGETGTAIAEIGMARPDSAGREQLVLLAQKLKADYIITGLITDYREGDIEFKKHKLELMGKLLWGNNGELCGMEVVKVQKKGDVQDMANGAAEDLAEKMTEKVK